MKIKKHRILILTMLSLSIACRKPAVTPEPNPLSYTKNMAGTRKWTGTTKFDGVVDTTSRYATLVVINDSTVIFDTSSRFRYKLKYVHHNSKNNALIFVYDSRWGYGFGPVQGNLDSLIYNYRDSSMRFYDYTCIKSWVGVYDLHTP